MIGSNVKKMSTEIANASAAVESSVETIEGLQRRMTVTIETSEIDSCVDAGLKKFMKTARVDGFRKGKVPLSVLKTHYGQAVFEDEVNKAIRRTLEASIEKNAVKPTAYPRIESVEVEPGKPVRYVALFDVFPTISLQPFDAVNVEKISGTVTDADVEKRVEEMRGRHATWQAVDSAAEDGDQVTIDFAGKIDGELFEGGSAENQELVLGSDMFIPGFEAQLVGVKAGESKAVSIAFPEDYHAKDLAGKPVVFDVTVHKVAKKHLPALDAEFLTQFDVENGEIAAFKQEIKENMERELAEHLKRQLKTAVFDQLNELHAFDLPTSLIEAEIDHRLAQFQDNLKQYMSDSKLSDLPDHMDRTLFEDEAKKQVKLRLILTDIVKQYALKVSADRVKQKIEEHAKLYTDADQMVRMVMENKQQYEQFESLVLEDTLIDLVLEKAKVEEKALSYDDIMKPEKEAKA